MRQVLLRVLSSPAVCRWGVEFGYIWSGELLYLARRVHDDMEIALPIHWSDPGPTFIGSMAWLLMQGVQRRKQPLMGAPNNQGSIL